MDVRAFGGSFYSYSATLPYSSGVALAASGVSANFPACRAVYVNAGVSTQDLQVILTDCPGTPITLKRVAANSILPISITSISGAQTTVSDIVLLY